MTRPRETQTLLLRFIAAALTFVFAFGAVLGGVVEESSNSGVSSYAQNDEAPNGPSPFVVPGCAGLQDQPRASLIGDLQVGGVPAFASTKSVLEVAPKRPPPGRGLRS